MEALSPAGLIGAMIGLILGIVDYKVVGGVVEARLRKLEKPETVAGQATFERKIRLFRWIFLVATVGAFPVVGYLTGMAIAGG